MGLDLLDIVFRLEKTFSIRIEAGDIFDLSGWKDLDRTKPLSKEFADKITVKTLCDLVEYKIRMKNDGIGEFPNVSFQVTNSVSKTLATCFNITDSSKIEQKLRLEQLVDLADSPLSPDFWRRFHKICRGDPDELKTIKTYARARVFISKWKTFCWSFGITFVWGLMLYLGSTVWLCYNTLVVRGTMWIDDFENFLTVLFIPGIILFGLQYATNWKRCGQASRITVEDIINHLCEQRTDHSVRADGFPYSRAEIEQGVAEILCEALAVKPEEIKPEARIVTDLGAE